MNNSTYDVVLPSVIVTGSMKDNGTDAGIRPPNGIIAVLTKK